MRIAYQGEPGAFSEAAALALRPTADTRPCETFDAVFAEVDAGRATHGILPAENSIAGTIHRSYDLLLEHELSIVAEVEEPIVHHLLARPGTRREDVRRVYSHPQALAQCERFLRAMAGVEIVASYDTAGSAKLVRDGGEPGAAAIASARAGGIFGLETLAAGIQDYAQNVTRFLVVARGATPLGTPDKTTVVFTLGAEAGALFRALSVFALRGIDLTKLESRPVRGRPWEYFFYADVAAARQDLACARALVNLGEFAGGVRTLGSYARWRQPADGPVDKLK
jgi:prephenate dehydratase